MKMSQTQGGPEMGGNEAIRKKGEKQKRITAKSEKE